eukprot:TRINITY_DN1464_c0_g1_i5.p1 TRINITY_DN1464_c0_g1~~TRINITY_DN1464_c0_g1_i5.p1  ORF type:complete len:247 (+),score=60.03 TRINITY_DN1464_c0_g1_i5:131-871(+)
MIRRPPRSTLSSSSAASDVYKRQLLNHVNQHTTTGSPKLSSKSALDTGSTDPSTGTDHVVNLHEGLPPLLRTGVHGKEGWPLWACAVALFVCLGLAYGVTDVVANSLALIFPDDVSSGQTGVRLVALVPVALAPNLLHFVNAISFGFQNRISVSIEIASQAVIQITLTLMPALIFLSTFMDAIKNQDEPFTMIFSTFHLFSVVFSMIVLNYVSLSGKVNYFEGAALAVVYLVWVAGFLFMPASLLS